MRWFGKPGFGPESSNTRNYLSLRINLFFFGTFFIFCIIIIRLAGLQFVESPELAEAEASRETKEVPLAAIRGIIHAAGGENIAYSTSIQSLYITLTQEYTAKAKNKDTGHYDFTAEAKANADSLVKRLSAVFAEYGDSSRDGLTGAEILALLDLDYKKSLGYVPRKIKAGLTEAEVAHFMENKDKYPGVSIVEESVRHYDRDTVAVQTVGYMKLFRSTESYDIYKNIRNAMKQTDADPGLMYRDDEFVGIYGLEQQYQRELRGKNGYQRLAVNPQNMAEEVIASVPPVKGNDIWMTIDKGVQMKTEQAITDQLDWLHKNPVQGKYHPDALTGYAVAMEVDTGNVVAMASMPDYDTNVYNAEKLLPEAYEKIKDNNQNGTITQNTSGVSGNGLKSLVFLGSTIKPLSVLIGLNEGFFSVTDTYTDKGIAYFGKNDSSSVSNSSGHVLGRIDPAEAIQESSNAFMVDEVGNPLYKKYQGEGTKVWDQYMKAFGLGVTTQSGLPGEIAGVIDYLNTEEAGSAQAALVYASFGQKGKYTALQLAQYTATLANEGERIKPQLVSRITDAEGNTVKEFKREVLNKFTFDPSYWEEIKQGMNTSVKVFDGFPYDFARKTGTSEMEAYGAIRDNGVFIAYAPREQPKLAVAVIIPEGGFGSNSAAPVARKIFEAYDWEYGLDGVPKKNLLPPAGQDSAVK
ncbi:penicillin-binding transpeptidase domain-containing protein [Paenibacillus sp. MMS20-IR301]|uniref:peptidoglycan D,D-transpeptidase FtsI family protein n=1 Tax=Paenibacillus sp. MMS20-IR301 TaxID=2895946 RepID=UPI0028E4C051|nr:penicillin-binding transpeptidase domain-containing protein [Paenibacillus sp. MMS20-IR301]WNS43246.1 penicillin-binding transpeptidase domain-containing protein [Paenibacillus sp. MMS20-IR301]